MYHTVLTLPDGTEIPNTVQFALTGRLHHGEAEGQGVVHDPDLDLDGKFELGCLEVTGDTALVAVVFTSGDAGPFLGSLLDSEDLAGWVFVIGFRDHGEGADSRADQASSVSFFPPNTDPCEALDLMRGSIEATLASGEGNDLTEGNVQVQE